MKWQIFYLDYLYQKCQQNKNTSTGSKWGAQIAALLRENYIKTVGLFGTIVHLQYRGHCSGVY